MLRICSYYFYFIRTWVQLSKRYWLIKNDLFYKVLMILLLSIFQLVAFRNCTRQWSMSRPLLPLILSNTDYFAQYQKQVISQAPPTRQQVLQEAFGKLNEGLDSSLSTKNRDRFTKNLYGAVKMMRE